MLVKLASALPAKAADGFEPSAENPIEGSHEELVTLAPEEEEREHEADPSEAEPEGESGDETRQTDESGEGEEKKPEKLSRNQRKNRKLAEQAVKIKELEDRLVRTQGFANDDLSLPRPEEFPGNYPAFARALRAYEVRRAVREENARSTSAREAAAELQRVRGSAYNERLTEVKDRIPDFEETLQEARRTDIRDDVRDLILESAKGPLIAYHLAKNLDKVAELNRMPQLAAAREIGRLEARIRGSATQTTNIGASAAHPAAWRHGRRREEGRAHEHGRIRP